MNIKQSSGSVPSVVLDTNASLDWFVFGDPGMTGLVAAIETGAVRWIASPRMREELLHTLSYPALGRWNPDCEHTLSCFDHWAALQPEPTPSTSGPLVCADPDDQVFMDLALTQAARWLVTHDRALHKLARQARRAGVSIVRPGDWRPE